MRWHRFVHLKWKLRGLANSNAVQNGGQQRQPDELKGRGLNSGLNATRVSRNPRRKLEVTKKRRANDFPVCAETS